MNLRNVITVDIKNSTDCLGEIYFKSDFKILRNKVVLLTVKLVLLRCFKVKQIRKFGLLIGSNLLELTKATDRLI